MKRDICDIRPIKKQFLFCSISVFIFIVFSSLLISSLEEKNTAPKNGIVIQTSQGVFDDSKFEEKWVHIHDEEDQSWTAVYIFRFRLEESPAVMLGQQIEFSIKQGNFSRILWCLRQADTKGNNPARFRKSVF
jgi:hypothetical protein